MHQPEARGVQGLPRKIRERTGGAASPAVGRVADQRMTDRAHVHPDLVRAASLEGHGQERCGIMVTHDLRMCRFVDKVLQMQDGKLERLIEDRKEIA